MVGGEVMRESPLVEQLREVQAAPDPTRSVDFEFLRLLRKRFSRGGLPAERTPEDYARLATFAVLQELLRLLGEFARRVQRGEALRLDVVEQPSTPGRMLVEVVIVPASQQKGREL